MKYAEALAVITATLDNFVFSSYPTETRKSLLATQEVLATIVPLVAGYHEDATTESLFIKQLEKIERCTTAEDARKRRREIVIELEQRGATLELRRLSDETIANIKRRIGFSRQLLHDNYQLPPVPPILTEEQICEQFDDETNREIIRNTQEAARISFENARKFKEAGDALSEAILTLSSSAAKASIAFIQRIPEQVYEIPPRDQIKWLWLILSRLAIQIIVISYVIEDVIAHLIEHKGQELFSKVEFSHKEFWFKAVLIVLVFFIGKIFEKFSDKKRLGSYKMALTSLVMNRARYLWIGYNNLVDAWNRADANLKEMEARVAKELKKRKKKLDNSAHYAFGELGEIDIRDFDPRASDLPSA
jgi:hypothetical protein